MAYGYQVETAPLLFQKCNRNITQYKLALVFPILLQAVLLRFAPLLVRQNIFTEPFQRIPRSKP